MKDLETQQLIIRNFTSVDWNDLFEIGMNYEKSEYAKYDQGPWSDSPEAYKGIVESWSKNDDFLAVVLKGDNKMIGFISVPRKSNKIFDFGFVFHPDYHGSGYATEACKVVLKHIFETFQAVQVNTGTAKENHPSCNLLRRLGFTFTGENKVSFRTDEKGNLIEFVALDFVISKEDYLQKYVS
jgi:RimJ/RimL family protein N-acetyltransferase